MKRNKWIKVLRNQDGVAELLVTLIIMPILLFMCFAIVPFFVYSMKLDHLHMIANHALKESEAVGYVSPTVIADTNSRLAALGLGSVVAGGTNYPSFVGSTTSKVLRDNADPTIVLILKYPAPNLSKLLAAVKGSGSSQTNEGYYSISLYGRSEAYE